MIYLYDSGRGEKGYQHGVGQEMSMEVLHTILFELLEVLSLFFAASMRG